MPAERRLWPKPLRRFPAALLVFGATFVPVAWWLFPMSFVHAALYWLVCALAFSVTYTRETESLMDRVSRKLPWWRD